MSVQSKLARQAERAEDKAVILRAKGGLKRELRAKRLEQKAALNWQILEDWNDERWG